MLDWPINKAKNNITNTLWSSPLISWLVVFLQVWKARRIYVSKLTNCKQPTSEDTSFPGLFFTKSEGKQQVCYLKTSATIAYNNAYKKFLEHVQRCDILRLILHSWRLRFLSQWASACVPRSEKSFPAKLSNETSFKMDSILICTRLLVNQNAPC